MAESDHPSDRRNFLLQVGLAGLGSFAKPETAAADAEASAAIPTGPAAGSAASNPYYSLGPDEAAFVEALVNIMCPADELSPERGRLRTRRLHRPPACGALRQGRRPLSAWTVPQRQTAARPAAAAHSRNNSSRLGIAAANAACLRAHGTSFDQLRRRRRKRRSEGLASGRVPDGRLPLASVVQRLVYPLFVEACFADPMYGGNRNAVFWKMIGYPGLPATHTLDMVKYRGKPYPGAERRSRSTISAEPRGTWQRLPREAHRGHCRRRALRRPGFAAADGEGARRPRARAGRGPCEGAEARLPNQRDELRWDDAKASCRTGNGSHTLCAILGGRHLCRCDGWRLSSPAKASAALPATGTGIPGDGRNTTRYCAPATSRATERMQSPTTCRIQDWGITYRGARALPRSFRKAVRIFRQGRQHQGGNPAAGGNPFEAPRRGEYPQRPLEITEAGIIFRDAADELGFRLFLCRQPTPPESISIRTVRGSANANTAAIASALCARLTPKERPIHCSIRCCAGAVDFEIRTRAQVLRVDYDGKTKRATRCALPQPELRRGIRAAGGCCGLAAFTTGNTRLLLLGGIGETLRSGDASRRCRQELLLPDDFRRGHIFPQIAGSIHFWPPAARQWSSTNSTMTISITRDCRSSAAQASMRRSPMDGRYGARRTPPGTPRWGTAWKQATADWYAHSFSVGAQGSCYPHRENFLDLDPDYTDAFGLPLLRDDL